MVNRHMKKYSASLVIREIQIKSTMRHHHTLTRMVILKKNTNNKVSKSVEKRGTSYTVRGKVNRCTTVENSMAVSQKLRIKLSCDPAILSLGIYPPPKKKKPRN